MKHLLASLPILASLTSPANCQPDPAMLFHERPGTCRGTSLEAGDGAVGRDEALCGSDAREAWALGISARGLFGLWRGMELVAAFSEGAETLAVRGGGGVGEEGASLVVDGRDGPAAPVWEVLCGGEEWEGSGSDDWGDGPASLRVGGEFGQRNVARLMAGPSRRLWLVTRSGSGAVSASHGCRLMRRFGDGPALPAGRSDWAGGGSLLVLLPGPRPGPGSGGGSAGLCVALGGGQDRRLGLGLCNPHDYRQIWTVDGEGRWRPSEAGWEGCVGAGTEAGDAALRMGGCGSAAAMDPSAPRFGPVDEGGMISALPKVLWEGGRGDGGGGGLWCVSCDGPTTRPEVGDPLRLRRCGDAEGQTFRAVAPERYYDDYLM